MLYNLFRNIKDKFFKRLVAFYFYENKIGGKQNKQLEI